MKTVTMIKYLLGIILFLCAVFGYMTWKLDKVTGKWKTAEANVKAYAFSLAEEQGRSRALQLSVRQLEYFNDSILEKLDATRHELKVKDKQLKALHYVASDFSKADTILMKDTLFKDPELSADTTLSDKWYSLRLVLKYPSSITAQASFKSEKHIVVFTDRETIKPPKKCALFRWFQKKQTVVLVDVVEKNPYVTGESQRYIEIVK